MMREEVLHVANPTYAKCLVCLQGQTIDKLNKIFPCWCAMGSSFPADA